MTIEECYFRLGADYQDVLRRFGNEERVKRFLCRLPEDKSYSDLCAALEEGRSEDAFRAAHSLKGICMNLGLTALCRSASALTEVLRSGKIPADIKLLTEQIDRDYQAAIQSIGEFLQP